VPNYEPGSPKARRRRAHNITARAYLHASIRSTLRSPVRPTCYLTWSRASPTPL